MSSDRVEPAYAIAASDTDLQLIGELCAIQGQMEYLMHRIVQHLLQTGDNATRKILGSTSIGTNIDLWLWVIRNKCPFPELVKLAEDIQGEISTLAQGRNDFVHALYAQGNMEDTSFGLVSGGKYHPAFGGSVAVRMKTGKKRSTSDLLSVRNTAARLSCAMAHLNHCLFMGEVAPTAWTGKS